MERPLLGLWPLATAVLLFALLVGGTLQLTECRLIQGTSRMSRLLRHLLPSDQARANNIQEGGEDFIQLQEGQHKEENLGGMAMAPSASSDIPPTPPTVPTSSCPPAVSECDFYFQGSPTTVPGLSISNITSDSPISPPIVASIQGMPWGASISVVVVNTAEAQYICNATAALSDSQFYTNGMSVQARSFQEGTLGNYLNQYVRLTISSVQIIAFGVTFNVNLGEANTFFPEERRCVIFQLVA